MKLQTFIILIAMVVVSNGQDKRSTSEILGLTEDIGDLKIFDLPRKKLEGRPADIFGKDQIKGIVAIDDQYSGPRSIISPIAKSFIDLVRSETPLSEVSIESPGAVIGMVRFASGECVLVRRSETQIILQFQNAWGALKRSDFPNILGITANIIPSSEDQDGAGQPATRPESKLEGGNKPQPDAEERSR